MSKALTLLIVLFCATASLSQGQATHDVKLPSGKIVKVIAVGQINFSNSAPALMMKYQTALKVTDKVALRKEVDEIWASFKSDVEQAKLNSAIVSANETPQGLLLKTASGYNFVFNKQPDDSWRCLDDEPKPTQSQEKQVEKKH